MGLEAELDERPCEVGERLLKVRGEELDVTEFGLLQPVPQERLSLRGSLEGADVPGERDDVSPPGLGVQEREDPRDVVCGNAMREADYPRVPDCFGVDARRRGSTKVLESGEGLQLHLSWRQ